MKKEMACLQSDRYSVHIHMICVHCAVFLRTVLVQHFTFNSVLRTWQARHGTVLSPKMPLPWRGGADVPEVWSDLLAVSNTPLPHDPMSLANDKQEAMLSRSTFVSVRESRCLPL